MSNPDEETRLTKPLAPTLPMAAPTVVNPVESDGAPTLDAATITVPAGTSDQATAVVSAFAVESTPTGAAGQGSSATNATLIADPLAATKPSTGGYTPGSVASHHSASAATDVTLVAGSNTGSHVPTSSSSFTNTGTRRRTRINDKLPADTQALDVKLQLSRVSVFADMVARAQGKLTAKFRKMVDDHGTHGRYVVNRPLAQGGMGAVLEIKDGDFQRRAAMKIILPKFAGTPETLERFLAEAQVTAQLEHPNIVPIHDLGVMEDGSLYFTMKFIEGTSLGGVAKKLKENDPTFVATWTLEHILLTFLKVLDGVGFANSKGVVHRDIKPDNIMIGAHGEVLVVDWGIAKVLGDADPNSELVKQVQSVRDQDNFSVTMAGHAIGTIYYMPPEQAEGRLADIDARSDVYALGATLYELVTLKRPVESGNLKEMVERVAGGVLIPALTAKPDLNPDLAAILMRSLAWRREDRYQSCADFAADLQRFMSGQAVAARQRSVVELLKAWYQQHRKQLFAGAAGLALLVGGIIGTLVYIRADNVSKAAALRDQAEHYLEQKDLDAADDAIRRSQDISDEPKAQALANAINLQLGIRQQQRDAEKTRKAASLKAHELLAQAQRDDAAGSKPEAVDKLLAAAVELAPDPEINAFRVIILAKLSDQQRQERDQRAVDNKAKGDRSLDAAAALPIDDPKLDQALKDAEFAYKDALSEGSSPAGIDISLARRQELSRTVAQHRAEQARRRTADEAVAKAKSAMTARQLDEARAFVEIAVKNQPGDATIDALRLEIINAQANADQERVRQANRERAAAAYTDACLADTARRNALNALANAKAELAALETSNSQDRSTIFHARAQVTTASQQVVENWAKTEQACATVFNGLDRDRGFAIPDGTVIWAKTRSMLAEVYWIRLQAARESGALADIAAFTNLLARVDDGTYKNQLTGDARLTIAGSGKATIQPLSTGNDDRFELGGTAESVTLPLIDRRIASGRFRFTVGSWHADLYLAPLITTSVIVPAHVPAIDGHDLTAVSALPGGKAFALGTTEITHRQYYAFITDRSVWPRVQANWKISIIEPLETAEIKPIELLPRKGRSAETITWQPDATGERKEILRGFSLFEGLPDLPVTGISRDDAEAYCAWLSAKSGAKVRLPTRQEWQWAATAGDPKRIFPWGEVFDKSFTVCALAFPRGKADMQKPGSNPADIGPFGHLDLAGNVREWLSDRPTPNDATAFHGALIAGGGYFDASPDQFRSTFVETLAPDTPNGQIGFRILVEIP